MPNLQELISEVDSLVTQAEFCQRTAAQGSAAELWELYLVWYQAALQLVPDSQQEEFRDMYEGGTFTSRIRSFLESPAQGNPFHDEAKPNPLVSEYLHPVARTFTSNIRRQQEILVLLREMGEINRTATALDHLAEHIARFGSLATSLRRRYDDRSSFVIGDEYDLQDLLDGVLRLFDEDVEREDFAPKMSGTGSRLDWILRTLEIAVEAKYCRAKDSKRKVRDELLSDFATFRSHPKTKGVLAVVYDPEFTLENPTGFVSDLEEHGKTVLPTRVVLVPRR